MKMVAEIVCVVCSLSSEPRTTEITFHRFPVDNSNLIEKWQIALGSILSDSPIETFKDTLICSRHFISDDFSFIDGKLILKSDAVPSVFPPIKHDADKPPTHGNNFASTSTVYNMTDSKNYPRTTSTYTETSKIISPSIIEALSLPKMTTGFDILESKAALNIVKQENKLLKRRLKRLQTFLKRMEHDNLLTTEYIDSLKPKVFAISLLI